MFGSFLKVVQSSRFLPWPVRRRALRKAGIMLASTAYMESGTRITGTDLTLGDDAYVNSGCTFDCRGTVSIGAGTLIGPGVMIVTATHQVMDTYPRAGPAVFEPIVIGRNAWIGAMACILPGAVIEDGCVVAAGSVVRGRLERDCLHAGIPAAPKRRLPVDPVRSADNDASAPADTGAQALAAR